MITSFVCLNGKIKEITFPKVKKYLKGKRPFWVDVEDPTQEELSLLMKMFKFHPLALEDSVSEQGSKIDDYENYSFILIHTLDPEIIAPIQLSLFLGKNYVVTIHKRQIKAIAAVQEKCCRNSFMLFRGVDFLVHTLLDSAVDEFFPLIDSLDNEIDEVEYKIFGAPKKGTLNHLLELKRKLFAIRKIVYPMRDVLTILSRGDFKFVQPKNSLYFKDVYDHLIRIIDLIDVEREMVTTAMEGYLSTISNNLNVIMKKLTSLTAILMLPTLIAGIYGMNFKYMPELDSPHGYYATLGLMIIFAIILLIYFHKKDWI